MAIKYSPEELSEREGTIDDLKAAEQESGFPGANLKFVSKEEQRKRKEAEVKDVDRSFAEYLKKNSLLVADQAKVFDIIVGKIKDTSYQFYLSSAAKEANRHKGHAYFEVISQNQYLLCLIDEQGNMHKVDLKLDEIPGALQSIAEQKKKPLVFIREQILLCGFKELTNSQYYLGENKLEKFFKDLENLKTK